GEASTTTRNKSSVASATCIVWANGFLPLGNFSVLLIVQEWAAFPRLLLCSQVMCRTGEKGRHARPETASPLAQRRPRRRRVLACANSSLCPKIFAGSHAS